MYIYYTDCNYDYRKDNPPKVPGPIHSSPLRADHSTLPRIATHRLKHSTIPRVATTDPSRRARLPMRATLPYFSTEGFLKHDGQQYTPVARRATSKLGTRTAASHVLTRSMVFLVLSLIYITKYSTTT